MGLLPGLHFPQMFLSIFMSSVPLEGEGCARRGMEGCSEFRKWTFAHTLDSIWTAGAPAASILVSFALETSPTLSLRVCCCSQAPALDTQVLDKQMCGNHAWPMSLFECILLRIPIQPREVCTLNQCLFPMHSVINQTDLQVQDPRTQVRMTRKARLHAFNFKLFIRN